MANFKLTEEQEAMQKLAHEFAEREVRPVAAELDEKGAVPWDIYKKAAEVGLTNYAYPEEYGGGGVEDPLVNCLVFEELAWGCAGVATSIGATSLAATPIMIAGTDEQKKRYISRFCDTRETKLGALCLTEPEAGSDASSISTTAKREGDYYILNGRKCFISNGGIADVHIVFATVDKKKRLRGITVFIVDGKPGGFSMGKHEDKMGIRASHTAEVIFDDVKVPVEDRLSTEGTGFLIYMETLDHSRPMIGAIAVGVARAALEHAVKYSLERVQFGQTISRHQAIAFKIADLAMQVEAARLLVWKAAWLHGEGLPMTKASSMAKCFAGDTAMRVTTEALQILGGYGYMRDYPMEKLMRDAKIMQIYEGTNEIQRLVMSREIFLSMRRGGTL